MDVSNLVQTIDISAERYPLYTFSNKGNIYTCINPFSYHMVRKYEDLYNKMDGLYVDGMLMCKLINFFWNKKIPRLSFDMSGMAVDLFNRLNSNSETIYFLGSRQESLEKSIQQIKLAYPNINIAGFRNGYFSSEDERTNAIDKIININPDFVIVGMGSPLQEKFCIDLKDKGYKGIAFTCGGFLHQTAENIKYYPDWINKYNLRAFYRLFREKGLWGRLWRVLIQFPFLFSLDTISYKLKSHK